MGWDLVLGRGALPPPRPPRPWGAGAVAGDSVGVVSSMDSTRASEAASKIWILPVPIVGGAATWIYRGESGEMPLALVVGKRVESLREGLSAARIGVGREEKGWRR